LAPFVKQSYDPSGSFTSVRNGNKFTVPAKKQRGVQFGVDAVASLELAQADLAAATHALRDAKTAERDAKARAQAQHQALAQAEQTLEALEAARQPRQQQLATLQRELAALQDSSAIDTSAWEASAQAASDELDAVAAAAADARAAKAAAEDEVALKTQARAAYEKTATQLSAQMQAAEAELTGVMRARKDGKDGVDKAQRKVDEVRDAAQQCQQQADDARAALQAATEAARTFTVQNLGADAKMPIKLGAGKGKDYVVAKIKTLKQRRDEGLRSLPKGERNLDEATAKAMAARATYNEKVADVKKVENNINFLHADIKVRLKKWKKFRKAIERITDKRFDRTLQRKGQSGGVFMDHKAETLSLTVQKDNRDSQSQIDNVKLLSGGERSYATLALLVALGECLECPFRIMDEFDVFMDVVSRKIALEQLVEEGLQNKHRQFVFITPQDLSSITPTPEVKIIKLQNPDRLVEGQATLG
jgi:chromosome segregation ATPase